jgi:low affinity Fe/Cu permease
MKPPAVCASLIALTLAFILVFGNLSLSMILVSAGAAVIVYSMTNSIQYATASAIGILFTMAVLMRSGVIRKEGFNVFTGPEDISRALRKLKEAFRGRRDDEEEFRGRRDEDEEGFRSRRDDEEDFRNRNEDEEGFRSRRDDDEEGFRSRRDDEEEFRNRRDDEEEGFRSRRDDEEEFRNRRDDEEEGFRSRRDDEEEFRNRRDDEEEGFRSRRDDEEEFRNKRDDEEEGFRSRRDDEEEGFRSRRDDEEEGFRSRRDDEEEFRNRRDDDEEGFTSMNMFKNLKEGFFNKVFQNISTAGYSRPGFGIGAPLLEGFEDQKKEAKKGKPAAVKQEMAMPFKLGEIPSQVKNGPHIDAGSTLIKAIQGLNPDQINAMTKDTKQLIETQKSLMGMLGTMKPMMNDGKELMETFQQMFGESA